MLEAGFEIERYVVEGILGEGGMALVYMVRHRTLGTRHALKVLSVSNKQVRERLIQEGQVQATLQHPNIVGVTDVIDVQGSPGLLMEYIEGAGLDHWLDYYQPTLPEALTIFKAIVAGVGHAHAQNLIHRDLKPGNVMLHVTNAGVVPKVTDFGLAKATDNNDMHRTRTGTTMGTPAYMAPEQIRDSSSVDRRADLYSLGCILYELVCNRTPYVEEDMLELFTMIRSGAYPDPREFAPDLPDAVVDTIKALITVKPEDRLSDCAAILEILEGDGRVPTAPITQGSVESLGPPRPIPPMMVTTLPPSGAAALAARSMIREVQAVPTGPVTDASWAGKVRSPSRPESPPPSMAPAQTGSIEAPPASGSKVFGAAMLLGVAGVLFMLVIVVVLLVAVLFTDDTPETVVVERPVLTPSPVPAVPDPSPAPVAPDTVPEPAPVVPEPAKPDPIQPTPSKPDPVRPTPSKPVPAKPEPAKPVPVEPAPVPQPVVPKPTKQPPSPTGKFVVDADGPMAVTIQGESGTIHRPMQAIPPGNYDILINGRRGAGVVTIREGRTVELQCYTAAARCKVR